MCFLLQTESRIHNPAIFLLLLGDIGFSPLFVDFNNLSTKRMLSFLTARDCDFNEIVYKCIALIRSKRMEEKIYLRNFFFRRLWIRY